MRGFQLRADGELLRILCLGAHGDDIEIGCGGTVLRLLEQYPDTQVSWVVFSDSGSKQRRNEAIASVKTILGQSARRIEVKGFRDGFFPFYGEQLKEFFEQLKREVDCDVVFTHCGEDLHQDHRLVSQLTWNTFRDHLILEYEIVKYDGDLGTPNFYVALDKGICDRKVETLMRQFESQRYKSWFTEDVFYSMLRLRGVECNSPGRYAEAFYARKLRI